MQFVGERFPIDKFHDEEVMTGGFFHSVNHRDVRMIQRSPHTLPTSTTPWNTSRSPDHTILSRVSHSLFLGLGISKADYI